MWCHSEDSASFGPELSSHFRENDIPLLFASGKDTEAPRPLSCFHFDHGGQSRTCGVLWALLAQSRILGDGGADSDTFASQFDRMRSNCFEAEPSATVVKVFSYLLMKSLREWTAYAVFALDHIDNFDLKDLSELGKALSHLLQFAQEDPDEPAKIRAKQESTVNIKFVLFAATAKPKMRLDGALREAVVVDLDTAYRGESCLHFNLLVYIY
jgi:hypothetical protein